MNKTPTVTIAIPAFNEEANILGVLKSIVNQKLDGLKLNKVVVVSDGSTDKTTDIVTKFIKQNKIVKLIANKERLGKVARLNEIYKMNTSEFLIIFDGDIELVGKNVVRSLCNILITDPKSVLVAAHQVPIKVNTLPAKIIYAAYKIWDDTRLAVPNFDNIQNFYGAASAYRKSFSDHLNIPKEITDERGYIYFMANKTKGFRYTKNAYIKYLPVTTFYDIWKMGDRSFSKNRIILAKLFGEKAMQLYEIPTKYKLISIAKNILQNPIYSSLGLLLNILLRVFPKHDKLYDSGKWETTNSTKAKIK